MCSIIEPKIKMLLLLHVRRNKLKQNQLRAAQNREGIPARSRLVVTKSKEEEIGMSIPFLPNSPRTFLSRHICKTRAVHSLLAVVNC
jgi:hypothetical protein